MKLLAEHADVREMSRAEAERLVRDKHDAAAAIVFPPKLSKQYLQGRSSEILLLTDPASGSDLQAVKVLLLLMDKEAAALADPFAEEKITLTRAEPHRQSPRGHRLRAARAGLRAHVRAARGRVRDLDEHARRARLGHARASPGRARRIHPHPARQARRHASSSAWCRCSCCSPGATSSSASRSARRRWPSCCSRWPPVFAVVAAGMLVAGLARSREQTLAARAVDGDGALGARRLLVAAVDAARLDESRRHRRCSRRGRCAG